MPFNLRIEGMHFESAYMGRRPGATNFCVEARNRIALSFVQAAGIPLDDQFTLMLQRQDLYQDSVHFNSAGATIQGDQATAMIRKALNH